MADEQAVALHAAHDVAMRKTMPDVVPEGWEDARWQSVMFPTGGVFVLFYDQDSYWGPFSADDFVTDDRKISTAHDHRTGQPVVLRLLHQSMIDDPKKWNLLCVNNEGEEVSYVMMFISDNTLDIQEPDLGQRRIQS